MSQLWPGTIRKRELLDSEVQRVRHVEESLRIASDAVWDVEMSRRIVMLVGAKRTQESPARTELLDVVIGGSHPNAILVVYSQSNRTGRRPHHRPKATRSGESVAPLDLELTGRREALNSEGGGVRGVDPATAIDGHKLGSREPSARFTTGAELAGTAAQATPRPQGDSGTGELLDAGVPVIGYVQTTVRPERQATGHAEFAWGRSHLAPLPHFLTLRGVDHNLMLIPVRHVHQALVVHGHSGWPHRHGERSDPCAIRLEDLDALVQNVGDVELVPGVESQGDRRIELPRRGAALTPHQHRLRRLRRVSGSETAKRCHQQAAAQDLTEAPSPAAIKRSFHALGTEESAAERSLQPEFRIALG